jgi:hypothetical protein
MAGIARKDVDSSVKRESAGYLGRDNGWVFPVRSRGSEIADQGNAEL